MYPESRTEGVARWCSKKVVSLVSCSDFCSCYSRSTPVPVHDPSSAYAFIPIFAPAPTTDSPITTTSPTYYPKQASTPIAALAPTPTLAPGVTFEI